MQPNFTTPNTPAKLASHTVIIIAFCVLIALAPNRIASAACDADVNNDTLVNVADLLAVINGWGACATPCPPNCNPDVNNDCSVNVTDLLAVINAWGPCPCTPIGPEPNDSCGNFTTLATVGSNQTMVYSSANLHNNSDIDLYRIHAMETDSSCSCCDGGFCTDEDFRLTLRLTVPSSASGSYLFCTGSTCAAVTTQCINVLPGQTLSLVWTFDGSCPGMDQYDVYVRISKQSGGSTACAPYTLTYQFEPGCF